MSGENGDTVDGVGRERAWWKGMAGVWAIAVGTVVVHVATGWRYGFNRDELMALEDARHLAWGYVQYPPMTAFFGWVALKLFGTSLLGFRFFAALAQALALVLAGGMAKDIGTAVASGQWRVAREKEKTQDPGSTNKPGAPALAHEIEDRKRKLGNREDGIRNSPICNEEPSGEEQWNSKTRQHNSETRNSKIEIPEKEKSGPILSVESGVRASDRVETAAHPTANEHSQECLRQGEWAPVVAAGAGVPFCLGAGALMQYISFDYVCWVLVAYGIVKLLKEEEARSQGGKETRTNEKWWMVVGLGIGLGMMAKWTMGLLALGVVAGVLATEARRFLRSGWLWVGVLVAAGIWAPNVWWQFERGFPSVEFLRFLHKRDVAEGLTDWFLAGQVELTLLAFPLALAGLWFCFFSTEGKPYRVMAWMYVVPLVLLLAMRGRDYYLAPGYPMLYAAGAVWIEKQWRVTSGEWREKKGGPKTQVRNANLGHPGVWVEGRSKEARRERGKGEAKTEDRRWGRDNGEDEIRNSKLEAREENSGPTLSAQTAIRASGQAERMEHPHGKSGTAEKGNRGTGKAAVWMRRWLPVVLVVDAVVAGCVALPVMPVNSRWWKMAAQVDTVLPEELGWEELTEAVARVRDGLPETDRARLGILARNYGEVGALNLYGEKHGLPRAISGVNSSWERGYGNPAPQTVITVGYSKQFLEENFASCELVAHTWNRYGVANEETIEDPDIFVCRGLKGSWTEFWKKVKLFA